MSSATLAKTHIDSLREQLRHTVGGPDLDLFSKQVWSDYGAGLISDQQANDLQIAIHEKRVAAQPAERFRRIMRGTVSKWLPRKPQRSPDREASRHRRRLLGGSGALPDTIRCQFTEGERSVLTIIAGEVKRHGVCDLPIDKIGALAGCGRTTVQNAIHEARRLGHIVVTERPRPGQKNLPNLVRIVTPEWLTWLKRGPSPSRGIGSTSEKVNPTKNIEEIACKCHALRSVTSFSERRWSPPPPPRQFRTRPEVASCFEIGRGIACDPPLRWK